MDMLFTGSSRQLSLKTMAAWHNMTMTEGEKLGALRQQLQQELLSIEAIAETADAAAATVALDQMRMGRLSRMDAMQGQAMVQATNACRQARVALIKAAMARMEGGEFGACQPAVKPSPGRACRSILPPVCVSIVQNRLVFELCMPSIQFAFIGLPQTDSLPVPASGIMSG